MNKNRRSFFLTSFWAALGLGSIWPAFGASKKKPIINGKFIHMVFFYLKEGVDVAAFRASTEGFVIKVPEVVSYHIGEPAGTPREVVDNTYAVSLVVTFHSKADQNAYQENADHKQFVTDNLSKWTRVQIYDSWGTL